MKKGVFIVLDGTDGSGKGTQTTKLVERLKLEGYQVETADFPQYGKKSAGAVEEYLNGNYGTPQEVGPYRASIFYAVDRYDASFKIRSWIDEGKIVICNRYVTANMGHQGSKITDEKELSEYLEWLHHLEYHIFNIPKPDLNIILHVTAETSQRLVDMKDAREYVGGKKRDIHEADINHLKSAEKTYLKIANMDPRYYRLVECEEDDKLLSVDEIHNKIWEIINPIIKK